jgi:DNA polymerase I-like protein with 3'-5' exonuclease and polymerase domains
MYGLIEKECKELLFKLKGLIPKTSRWQQETTQLAKSQGWLVNPFSRRRFFYTEQLYTESLAFLPQSTAADIIFRAMIGLMQKRIGWAEELALQVAPASRALPEPAELLLQVHDSLVVEYPREMREEVVGVLRYNMEQPWRELGGFKIPVEVKVGDSWGAVTRI